MKLSWHIQAPDNKISPSRIGHIYWLLRFADGKYRQETVATRVPLRRFRRFLRKKWFAAAKANWKTNRGESRGIPGHDFRCRWLTPCLWNRWVVPLIYFRMIKYMIETQSISCLLCQIIGIYTHLNPLNLWNRATNIFISLLIHLFLLFATIRRYSSLFVTIRRYSRLFALFGHYSSLFATICTIRVTLQVQQCFCWVKG